MGFAERLARMAAKPMLDVQVCDHCNLRCAGCLHFAPLAEEHCLDVEAYERDLSCLASVDGIEGYFGSIALMGGEPLLHPHVASHVPLLRCRRALGRAVGAFCPRRRRVARSAVSPAGDFEAHAVVAGVPARVVGAIDDDGGACGKDAHADGAGECDGS